jgi:hypothetical protein
MATDWGGVLKETFLTSKHAMLACLVFSLLAVGSVPLSLVTPMPQIVSTVGLVLAVLWMLAGANVGWFPRRI